MAAYYNEIDPYAATWLGNLSAGGYIAPGHVDTRSVVDLRPADVAGYAQCHFFAGIAGWSLALRLAGWGDDRPVWTGSCPCQPFSAAGRRAGFNDERHLWPAWFRLIRECRPAIVFGEQVEAAVRLGWLDAVFADLEGEGYACGAVVLGAHSVGAPHIRQRLWFVAYATEPGWDDAENARADRGDTGALPGRGQRQPGLCEPERSDAAISLGNADRQGWRERAGSRGICGRRAEFAHAGGLGDALLNGLEGAESSGSSGRGRRLAYPGSSPWSDLVWLPCRDGKARPTRPGLFPLAHGIPARVGKLRAAGNAIVPQVAASFIAAFMASEFAEPRP